MEIRFHGRGGQGGVTCAKIVAASYARLGKSVQTFGDYSGERSGAPVRAYTRVSDAPIANRNKVYEPDHLVVLDEHLLGQDVRAGMRAGGTLLLNSANPPEAFAGRWGAFRIAVVDATAIAREHGIGTRTVVIVNTTIAGAFARVHAIPWEVLEATYRQLGFLGNLAAARRAFESVQLREADRDAQAESVPVAASLGEVEALTAHVASPATGLRTGSWSAQRPAHVDHLAPCSAWCPAGNDVVGFVRALAASDQSAAARILASTTPLPGVCGRVCPAPCMQGCNRSELDGAVNIRGLERWIAPLAAELAAPAPRAERAHRIAIVGGGPAGLGAAHALARAGQRAQIFESEARLGGVLWTGIPSYRLPREVLTREIDALLAQGVEARCGQHITRERLLELSREYAAVILATGLQRARALELPGAQSEGVEQGLRFLKRVNTAGPLSLRGHVVVLGGGNTALDCARSALRCGAERVTIAYRRSRAEMPAIPEEIEQALHEGIALLELRAPVGFQAAERVTAVELARVELGEPDASGRREPMLSGVVELLPCDHVLLALGQSAELAWLPPGWELRDGRVSVDGQPSNVFAAGDLASGDGTVTHALGSGRRAAGLVLRMLGEGAPLFERPERAQAVPITDIRVDHFARSEPARDRSLAPAERVRGFAEVDLGLADAREALRCFSCGHCTHCDTCLVYCPEGIIRRAEDQYAVDYSYCKGCGICVKECPRGAMEMSAS